MSLTDDLWKPMSRDDVVRAVERRNPSRVPLVRAKWWGEGLEQQYGERLRAFDRYLLVGWWRLFFERLWGLRGMESLMVDYYTEPENVQRLPGALCTLYCGYIRRAKRELQPDGFWTSDDLGHQTGPMMNPEIFRQLVLPHYRRVGDTLRECGMHFWLHSCGDNTLLLDDLIEAGVDVFHPVQKHTMDEKDAADQIP